VLTGPSERGWAPTAAEPRGSGAPGLRDGHDTFNFTAVRARPPLPARASVRAGACAPGAGRREARAAQQVARVEAPARAAQVRAGNALVSFQYARPPGLTGGPPTDPIMTAVVRTAARPPARPPRRARAPPARADGPACTGPGGGGVCRGPAAKRQQRRGAHRAGRASAGGRDGPPQQQQRRGAARPAAPRRRGRGACPRPGGACGAAGRRGSEEGLHVGVTRGRGGRAGGRDSARGSGGLRVSLGSGQGIGRGPRLLQPRRAARPPPGSRRLWAREVCGALSLQVGGNVRVMLEALEAESLPEEGWVYAGSSSVDLGPLASVRTERAGVLAGGKSRVFVANKDAEPPVRPPPAPLPPLRGAGADAVPRPLRCTLRLRRASALTRMSSPCAGRATRRRLQRVLIHSRAPRQRHRVLRAAP
jgi:hypothetical protein